MADIEIELLSAICGVNKSDQQKILQSGISPTAFIGYETEANYVWQYFEKYQVFPALKTFRKQYPNFPTVRVVEPLQFYVDRMIERKTFKSLQGIITKVNKQLQKSSLGGVKDALHEMVKAQELLRDGYSSDRAVKDWDLLSAYMDREKGGVLYTTPYASLNRMIRGFRHKNLVSIVARPAVGKSWLLTLFANCFKHQGARVLFISKEMTADEVLERLVCLECGIPWIPFVEGRLKIKELMKYEKIMHQMTAQCKGQIVVSDSEDLAANGLDSVLGKVIEHQPDIVLIDGAYLLDEAEGNGFVEKAMRVSRATKRLAKNRNVLVVQTLQMNRRTEEGEDVGLQNIGLSDAYGQDSDAVIYLKGLKNEPTRILELLKGRTIAGGGMGEFYISFSFDPLLDFCEIKQGSAKKLQISTIEG